MGRFDFGIRPQVLDGWFATRRANGAHHVTSIPRTPASHTSSGSLRVMRLPFARRSRRRARESKCATARNRDRSLPGSFLAADDASSFEWRAPSFKRIWRGYTLSRASDSSRNVALVWAEYFLCQSANARPFCGEPQPLPAQAQERSLLFGESPRTTQNLDRS